MERSNDTARSPRIHTTFFSGRYALVLKPDPHTQAECQRIAADLCTGPGPHPFFLTLYGGVFDGLPEGLVADVLFRLMVRLIDQELVLSGMRATTDAPSSIVWEVSPVPFQLHLDHLVALGLARYLDPVAIQRTLRQHPNFSQEEREAVLEYGDPETGRHFYPRIVLGQGARPGILHDRATIPPWTMSIHGVHFVHLGDDGIPTKIIV